MEELGTVVQMILVFILVLGGCWWFTRKFAKAAVRTAGQSKYMKVIDRIMLGQDKYMGIVEAGSRYFIISVTSGEIRILTELEETDLVELKTSQEHRGVSMDFKNVLEKIKREKDTKL